MQRQELPQLIWVGQGQLPVFAWGVYGGALKRAIAALKYENQPQLARPLGHWLAKSWLNSQLASKALIVVPIPLHPDRQKQRGYNQAALLAQSFCEITGLHLQQMGLERMQATKAQFGLSIREREKNLANAFGLGPGFRRHRPAKPVLLVDDIYTTGATARSAVETLHHYEIQVYGLATIATPRGAGGPGSIYNGQA
jgi:ComF family protein